MNELHGIYPVITMYQPWATWVMRKWKDIESRTHPRFACLLGRMVLIHAGQTTDKSDAAINNPYLPKEDIIYKPEEIINGFILGSTFVWDFGKLDFSDSKNALIDCGHYAPQRWGLYLEKTEKFETPIPEKGEMGIWYYDMDNMCKVKKPKPQSLKLF